MIKKLYTLIFVLLLAGCSTGTVEYIPPVEPNKPAYSEDKNMAENVANTHGDASYEENHDGAGYSVRRVISNVNDGDDGSSFELYVYSHGGPGASCYLDATIALLLDAPYYIGDIVVRLKPSIYGTSFENSAYSITALNGTEVVTTLEFLTEGLHERTVTINSIITKIHVQCNMNAQTRGGDNPAFVLFTVYEIKAFLGGEPSGLKVKTASGSTMLLKDATGLSPLRVRKGSTTVALVLVPTTNSAASPLRIRHNGVTYAVAKL